jgi:hypothetical protein
MLRCRAIWQCGYGDSGADSVVVARVFLDYSTGRLMEAKHIEIGKGK